MELGYVTLKVCDAEGRMAPRACPQVCITVTAGGEFVFVAVDNGDESDFTLFGAKECRAFNGLLSVIVRAKKGVDAPIEIKVESKGLEPATVLHAAGMQ